MDSRPSEGCEVMATEKELAEELLRIRNRLHEVEGHGRAVLLLRELIKELRDEFTSKSKEILEMEKRITVVETRFSTILWVLGAIIPVATAALQFVLKKWL